MWSENYKKSEIEPNLHMQKLMEYLHSNEPDFSNEKFMQYIGLIHGDFRIDNIIFHSTEPKIMAILDWELSTIGPIVSDLIYNL